MGKKRHSVTPSMNALEPTRTTGPGAIAAKGQYDAIAPGAKKKRREAKVETSGETGKTSRQLPPMSRLLMVGLVRDAARNFSSSRAMLKQMGLNVVGTEYKLRIKIDHDARDPKDPVTAAQAWFNKVFAKNCDFRGDLHLFDKNRLLVQGVARDGDQGMLFDRDFTQTGRLIDFETDQICDPDPLPAGAVSSNDGILLDAYGREIGYCTHAGRGKTSAPLADCHIFPRDPVDDSKNMFRLFRVPWRANQGRGTSDMFSCVADLLDVYEMRAKELQSAKVAASLGGIIKKKDQAGGPAFTDPRYDPTRAGISGPSATGQPPPPPPPPPNYDRLESLTGGYMQYLDPDDVFELLQSNRPNVNGIPFAEHIIKSAGWAGGMARCYSTGEAQTSYTAFRGELIMTWIMFKYWHKWLERYAQDWQAVRAINFAVQIGKLQPLPEGWEYTMAWQHPKMPSVNPLLDQQTFLAALKNGATNLEEELGPGWRDTVEELIKELEVLRGKVPHAIFETKSGGLQEGDGKTTTPQTEDIP